jgi:hypothetical protein
MRLFAFVLLAMISSVPAFARDACGSLLERTQAFSDAGQRKRTCLFGRRYPASGRNIDPYDHDHRLGLQDLQ